MCFGCFGFSVFVLMKIHRKKVNNLVGGLTKD